MRFYFIILTTASTFLIAFDRIHGSKLTNMSPMNPADSYQSNVTVERMRLAVNETADEIEEERTPPSSSAVAAVHAIESKWKKTPAAFPRELSDELIKARELIIDLSNEMTYEHTPQSIRTLLTDNREFYDHASLIYALGQLKHIPPWGVSFEVSQEFHHLYLEGLVEQGYTPLQMLSELNEKWVPSESVIRNLKDYTEMFNERYGTQISMLTTLMEYVGNDYDLALVMSHLRRYGGEIEEQLYNQLATYYAQHYILDDLFELLRPRNGESEWNFEMLYYVNLASGQNTDLLQFLEQKLGGVHELAPILAGADELDIISKKLQKDLVMRLVVSKDFGEVVQALNLREAALTRNNLETFRLYTLFRNRRYRSDINWRRRLAAILRVDVSEIPIL